MKAASIYIDSVIHPDFEQSPFFQKAERLMKNKGLKTAIFASSGTSNKVLQYFTNSDFNIVFDEKNISDTSVVMTSDTKMLDILHKKGFTTLFVIDENAIIRPNLFSKLRDMFDVHYLTTAKAYQTVILNDCVQDDKFFFNTLLFIESQNSILTSLIVPKNKEFFQALSRVDVLIQPFLVDTNYFFSELDKPLKLLDGITKSTKPITVDDLVVIPVPSSQKIASLNEIETRMENRDEKDKKNSLNSLFDKITPLIKKVSQDINSMNERLSQIETNIERKREIEEHVLVSGDAFDIDDPLSYVRNNKK